MKRHLVALLLLAIVLGGVAGCPGRGPGSGQTGASATGQTGASATGQTVAAGTTEPARPDSPETADYPAGTRDAAGAPDRDGATPGAPQGEAAARAAAPLRPLGYMRLAVKWPAAAPRSAAAIPPTTVRFQVVVTVPEVPASYSVRIDRQIGAATQSATIAVPAGTDRSVEVSGFNAAGRLVANGSAGGIEVERGQFKPVTVAVDALVGRLAGLVKRQDTGELLAGVDVSAGGVATTTAGDGTFALDDVTAGIQTVTLAKNRFKTVNQSAFVPAGGEADAGTLELARLRWFAQPTSLAVDLFSVDAISATEAWASGEDGFLTHTTDGEVWVASRLPTTDDVLDVQFADACTGYALTPSTLYQTADCGAEWRAIATSSLNAYSLAVLDAQTVLVGRGGSGGIRKTSDGGESFQDITVSGAPPYFTALAPLDANTIWAADSLSTNAVFLSTNGGVSWQRGTDLRDAGSAGNVADRSSRPLAPIDALRAMVVGWVCCTKGTLWETQDGGSGQWTVLLGNVTGAELRAIAPLAGGYCAVGAEGTVRVRHAGSDQWEAMALDGVADPGEFDLNDVEFVDEDTGWAVGRNGACLRY